MNQLNPIRILIVDDDPLILFMLEKIIQRQPDLHVMGMAHNGNDALAVLHDSQPDVVLLDIEMPHMNGNPLSLFGVMGDCIDAILRDRRFDTGTGLSQGQRFGQGRGLGTG
jgi:AmiR/NasT family two-component response regulator